MFLFVYYFDIAHIFNVLLQNIVAEASENEKEKCDSSVELWE